MPDRQFIDPDVAFEEYRERGMNMHDKPSDETLRFMEQQIKINLSMEEKVDKIISNQLVQQKTIDAILTQTTKTNGRVTKLEGLKNMAIGALIIINLFFVPVAVAFLISKLIHPSL